MAKRIKVRICAYSLCKKEFKPTYSTLQVCCSVGCSINYNKKVEQDKRVKKMKQDLKTHSDYVQILQKVFNTYIRLRDKGGDCISCKKPLGESYHAGHFFPTTKQYLRFNEDNAMANMEMKLSIPEITELIAKYKTKIQELT